MKVLSAMPIKSQVVIELDSAPEEVSSGSQLKIGDGDDIHRVAIVSQMSGSRVLFLATHSSLLDTIKIGDEVRII